VAELLRHLGGFYRPYAQPHRPRPRDVDELIDIVGLADKASAKVATLSGGERRRMDLAIGIIGRPDVLFLDEPTAGLDPVARRDFHELVHSLSDLEDTTVILATHDLDEADKLADRIVILDRGGIVANGSADQLARAVSSRSEVRWSVAGEHFVHTTHDATGYVRELFAQHGRAVHDLEVRRASLEDAYMAIVLRQETDLALATVIDFAETKS
jgi:ABC-2 type transport system ATP-binding protein